MLQIKDFNFTAGDLVQRKFGGYQITYKMTTAQKTAFQTFLGDEGKTELDVHAYLQTNNIQVVNQPNTLAQDVETGTNAFETVITSEGQNPLIKTVGEDADPTVRGDARGTPTFKEEDSVSA